MTSREWTAQAVADLVGGRLLGHPATPVRGVAALDRAGPDDLAPLLASRYLAAYQVSRAGTVLVGQALEAQASGPACRIVVANPTKALIAVLAALYPEADLVPGIHGTAQVAADAVLGQGCQVGPQASIGAGARLGARCRIDIGAVVEAGAVLGDDCVLGPRSICHGAARLGHRVVLKAGAVVGGRGFGFASDETGHRPIPHVGGCFLEDDVHIGANSCVDRGSIDDTVIGAGTKLDNLVHVGHNVRIGRGCLLMAGVGVGGSCRIGDGVVLAGHVGIVDHLTIGDGVRVGAKSGVIGDVPAGAEVSGYPARPHREFLRGQAALYRLPSILSDLEALVTKRGARGTTNS